MAIIQAKTGANIKKLREKYGYSQKSIADYLQMDQSNISLIESGKRPISVQVLNKLSSLFCCTTKDLLSGEDVRDSYHIAFRAKNLETQDFEALSAINRIMINQDRMDKLRKGDNHAR